MECTEDALAGTALDHVAGKIGLHLDIEGLLHDALGNSHFNDGDQARRDQLSVARNLIDYVEPKSVEWSGHRVIQFLLVDKSPY